MNPDSILYKFIAGRYRPVREADGPITACYIFIKNALWEQLYFEVYQLHLVDSSVNWCCDYTFQQLILYLQTI